MADWLEANFGPTLCASFFAPFHALYTAGLWSRIAPQDAYKSPVDLPTVIQGAFEKTAAVGYNASFIYPRDGLDALVHALSERTNLCCGKRAASINTQRHEVFFCDGSSLKYDQLISTLPLNTTIGLAGLEVDEEPAPYTSVLVLNVGARRGAKCPDDHWLYIPDSNSGFYRVGFYSNVDSSFLPASSRERNDHAAIYIERAYRGGEKPSEEAVRAYAAAAVEELQEWQFIAGEPEVADRTWIDVAYTWTWPDSNWRQKALALLEQHDIIMVGRYGRWVFQGIADSIRDGLTVGAAYRASPVYISRAEVLASGNN